MNTQMDSTQPVLHTPAMNYLVVIPARGGSKGLPRKNILTIADKPLIAWTIQHALNTPGKLTVIVSTDDEEIASVSKQFGAIIPFLRPKELATDFSTTESALIHAAEWFKERQQQFDAVILLQPTSPVRQSDSLQRAINQFESEQADSLLSVTKEYGFFWKKSERIVATYDYKKRPRRQDIDNKDLMYRENGSIYITKTTTLLKEQNRIGGIISLFEMNECESVDIDNDIDLQIAEMIINRSQQQTNDQPINKTTNRK